MGVRLVPPAFAGKPAARSAIDPKLKAPPNVLLMSDHIGISGQTLVRLDWQSTHIGQSLGRLTH
ncbi:hypothetical protein [Algirhabdus cladophorae]|uniref:hypothetical protein n=1 Tax=Algirhabdus cladophorae TaxID=3377108 RepID=UPI003B84886A